MIEPTNGDIWKLNTNVICVNPANPDDKMEFKSVEALNQKLFDLKAQVERLTNENETRRKDMESLFASYQQALEDIRRLHWDLRDAKEGKPRA